MNNKISMKVIIFVTTVAIIEIYSMKKILINQQQLQVLAIIVILIISEILAITMILTDINSNIPIKAMKNIHYGI